MWSKLVDIFTSLQKGTLKNVLSGAGIMLTSSVMFMTAFSAAVTTFKNTLNGVGGDVLALAHLAGFDLAMSIILSAVVTRLSLSSSKLMLKKQ